MVCNVKALQKSEKVLETKPYLQPLVNDLKKEREECSKAWQSFRGVVAGTDDEAVLEDAYGKAEALLASFKTGKKRDLVKNLS